MSRTTTHPRTGEPVDAEVLDLGVDLVGREAALWCDEVVLRPGKTCAVKWTDDGDGLGRCLLHGPGEVSCVFGPALEHPPGARLWM